MVKGKIYKFNLLVKKIMNKIKKIGMVTALALALSLSVSSYAMAALTMNTTTVSGSGALTLTGATASTWSATTGDLTIDGVAGSLILDSGEATADAVRIVSSATAGGIDVDAGTGGITVDSTGAISVDGVGASNVTTDTGALTLATTTSGTLSLSGVALVDIDAGANLDVDVTGDYTMDSTGTFSVDGVGASNVTTDTGALTLATTTSGNIVLTSAADVTITGDTTFGGTTPVVTVGDAGAEDAAVVYDGNTQDFYVGLDDTADDLVMGVGSALGTTQALAIDENTDVTVSGNLITEGALDIGTVETFTDSDATPDVSDGSYFITNTTGVTITDFDGAGILAGQIIVVESAGAIVYDVTAGDLKGGTTDITTADGDLTTWVYNGTDWLLISFMDLSDDMS